MHLKMMKHGLPAGKWKKMNKEKRTSVRRDERQNNKEDKIVSKILLGI